MNMKNLLLIGALGLGAYFLFVKKVAATEAPAATAAAAPAAATPGFTTINITPDIKVQVPTTSAIPTYYATPSVETSKSNIFFKSAAEAIAASSAPAVTAATISKLGSYAVSPYSTYRVSTTKTAASEAARKAAWK